MFIPNWAGGLDAALDVTVINPLQGATAVEAAATPDHALELRYGTKMYGAAEACKREGIVFLPLVVESLGGWHKVAERKIKKLAAAKERQEEEEAVKHAFTRLSVLLMHGNAAITALHLTVCCSHNLP